MSKRGEGNDVDKLVIMQRMLDALEAQAREVETLLKATEMDPDLKDVLLSFIKAFLSLVRYYAKVMLGG